MLVSYLELSLPSLHCLGMVVTTTFLLHRMQNSRQNDPYATFQKHWSIYAHIK